jgi:crotonobetainyl-CoA:carnitine CoA-transferase CaiB-like acyl-CoA transferase
MGQGPLEGLRVIDLTNDCGRFATKLLTECGASVARIGRGTPGPAMRVAEVAARGGLLDWWYDGGKHRLPLDLERDADRDTYRRLAATADLVIETEPPGRLADLGIDHSDLVGTNAALVQVSLTPFGRTGPRAGWQTTDLVTAALGGVLSLSGLPDEPVNPWGHQSFNVAGFIAAISGLAGVRAARMTGAGQHIDLAMHEAVCTTIEQLFFQYWFDDVQPYAKVAPRQGSLHWIGAYVVVPAKTGWLMITPAPNVPGLLRWMSDEGFPEVEDLMALSDEEVVADVPRLMKTITSFCATQDANSLFHAAQERHIAFGEVQSVAQVAANPQHAFREFFRPVDWSGPAVNVPGPVARFHGTPVAAAAPPAESATDVDDLLAEWGRRPTRDSGAQALRKPLEGLRVVDLSHVLAGPFCTRLLGDLGADVIKFQTADRATIVNDPNHPYFYVWNRSKRAVSLNMKDPRAVDVARRVIEQADVVIENFSAGVLARWGLAYETVSEWNPAIVYLTMSGCGHEGPWSSLVTYAPTIHALSGLTYLSNPPGRGDVGPGFSLNDHAAGLSAAFSILAALEARERTGRGQHVDISQMETGAYLIGPAVLDYLVDGREAQPVGNADPFGQLQPNNCYPTADGRWLAVSCRDDAEWRRLVTAIGADRSAERSEADALVARWAASMAGAAAQATLQDAGVPAGLVQDASDLMADPQLLARDMWHTCDHAVFGERPYDRFPALWSAMDLHPYIPPPAYVGEHNFDVYAELADLDAGAVAEGMADGLFS